MSESDDLVSHLSFGPVNKSTIGILRLIHLQLLPVHYPDSIYDIIKTGTNATGELAYLYGDVPIGEMCYRAEEHGGVKKIYIMTIGVLKTYQKHGFGRRILERGIEEARKKVPDATEVYLNVHVENTGAMAFYEKMGFTKGELQQGYYKSLDNGDAYIFSKQLV